MKLSKGTILSAIVVIGGVLLDALAEKNRNDEMQLMIQEEVAKQFSKSEETEEES